MATLLKRDISYEFCEIFKNTYFVKQMRTAASVYCQANVILEKRLLVRDLLPIHMIELCQKYENRRNIFDSFTNS